MEKVNVALFAGASCVGKSTITKRLAAQRNWPAFDNDVEICGRIFDLFYEPSLKNSLGDLASWKHLREWREQTYHAFRQFLQYDFQLKLFILDLNYDEFFVRYLSAQQEGFHQITRFSGSRFLIRKNKPDNITMIF
ncbi:hypothetical protein Pan153_37600 [Gimesia panareensis]|uniref:Uncharacterized protein n=1 Tax=Gimesia panareensis TaxID=2527978 RepID=A0A518FRX4_9PLAN|nr:hypothetical protein [Gimesia panareensis]QDV19097.1 hypothetical protein Pan153_37600 [Gimesia panareensis]